MQQNYKFLSQFHKNTKFKIISYFANSKLHILGLKITFCLYQLFLFFLKYTILLINPLLPKIKSIQCDILVWGDYKGQIKRSENLWNKLRKKGYKIEYYSQETSFPPKFLFKQRLDLNPKIPAAIFINYVLAKLITTKYNFSILADYHNFEITSVLIKNELKPSQKNIFIPHSIIFNTYKHSTFTFDYYFVFGKSSVENIKKNTSRLGSTKLVEAGSAFIPKNFSLPNCHNYKNILFFSNWAIHKYRESNKGLQIALNWAKKHQDYNLFIRLHPLENEAYIKKATKNIPNVIIQNKSLSLKASLLNISICLTTISTATVEAAILNRPSLVVLDVIFDPNSDNILKADSYLQLEKFFPKRAGNADDLHKRILQISNNYDFYVQKCKEYANFHIAQPHKATEYMAEVIEKIYHNKIDFPYIEIPQNIKI